MNGGTADAFETGGRPVDPALEPVRDLVCRTLVVDIETVPATSRDRLPPSVGEALTGYAGRRDMEPDKVMGMSPFFGRAVSLAVGNGDADLAGDAGTGTGGDEVAVLAVPPAGCEVRDRPPWLRLTDEAGLLRSFWALAALADVVVTFNGRNFDVPFLVARSLVHGIPVRRDLVSGRHRLKPHLDLCELLGTRGIGPSKLDVVCWAFDIESPKQTMDGSQVAPAYERGEIVRIADYNRHDVRATSAVYRRVRDLVLRFRPDWS